MLAPLGPGVASAAKLVGKLGASSGFVQAYPPPHTLHSSLLNVIFRHRTTSRLSRDCRRLQIYLPTYLLQAYLFPAELFATPIRGTALGIANFFARTGTAYIGHTITINLAHRNQQCIYRTCHHHQYTTTINTSRDIKARRAAMA